MTLRRAARVATTVGLVEFAGEFVGLWWGPVIDRINPGPGGGLASLVLAWSALLALLIVVVWPMVAGFIGGTVGGSFAALPAVVLGYYLGYLGAVFVTELIQPRLPGGFDLTTLLGATALVFFAVAGFAAANLFARRRVA